MIVYFLIVSIVIEFLFPDNSPYVWWIQSYMFFMFYFLMEKLKGNNTVNSLNIILRTILIALAFWIFRTLQGLLEDASIARAFTRSNDYTKDLANSGYGGFGLVYSSLLALPLYLNYIRRNQVRILNTLRNIRILSVEVLIVINFILTVLLVIKAGYLLALAIMLSYFLLEFIFKGKSRVVVIKLGSFLAMVSVFFSENLLAKMQDLGMRINANYVRKINDILTFRSSLELENNTLYHRLERYKRSLEIFNDNILFGALSRDDTGKHSAILDTFAHYGFFLGAINLAILTFFLTNYIIPTGNFLNRGVFIVFLTLIFTANNIVGSQGLILFILYPLVIKDYTYAKI